MSKKPPNSQVAQNQYGRYCIPVSSSHRPAARIVLQGGIYEPETIKFMTEHCGKGDIVHAGTYFGDFLPAISSAASGTAKVWAFEPNSENFRCAEMTLELNGIKNVALENAGLGERPEKLTMVTADQHGRGLGGASRLEIYDPAQNFGGKEIVKIVTIDEQVPSNRNVSIVQLDIEGHELKALRGGLKTITRCRPILILEVWPEADIVGNAWFSENILSLGYQASGMLHENAVFRCPS